MRKLIFMLLVIPAIAFAQQGSYTVIRTAGTLPSSCVVGGFIQKTGTSAGMYFCSASNTWSGPLLLTASSGTLTNIATTSPISGGPITTTGTLSCPTCVVASSPGAGVAHFAGSTQTVTSSAIVGSDMTNNTVTSTQLAIVNTRRTCYIETGDGSNTTVTADYSPFIQGSCAFPYPATLVEINIQCDAGTPSILLQRRRGSATLADLLSGALASAGTTHTCAMSSTGATCIDGTTSSGSITLSNTSLNAGDVIEVKSGTGSTEKRCRIQNVVTVN